MKSVLLVVLFSLLFSCENTKVDLLKNKSVRTSLNIDCSNISIPIDENTLTSYQIISCCKTNKNNYIVTYNRLLHALDIFNIDKKLVEHILLEEEGINGILRNVSGLHVQDLNSFWLYSQGYLYNCDHKGSVKKKIKLPCIENGFIMVDTNFSTTTSRLFYNQKRMSIFYLTVGKEHSRVNYVVYEYCIESGHVNKFPLRGKGEEDVIGFSYGWLQFPNVTYSSQFIYYNFPINSNIYRLSLEEKDVESFGGQSIYTDNQVEELVMPYDFEKADKHLTENVHFFELNYDPYKQLFYRLHLNGVEYQGRKKSNEAYNSKELFLTIFDSDFHLLKELSLGTCKYNYLNSWGVIDEGFFIVRDNTMDKEKDPEKFEIDIFNVSK